MTRAPSDSMSTPLMRVCAEKGTKVRAERLDLALAQVELLLGEHDDAAAFGRLVGQRGELRDVGEFLFALTPVRAGRSRSPGGCPA
jgi:hypothetical protein